MKLPVYLDFNATTPVAPEVADAMIPYLREHFGNPSSSHVFGQRAKIAVAQARAHVAALINAKAENIVFTGSATEANNLALLGVAHALGRPGHLIVSAVEHPAVAEPARRLEEAGWSVTVAPVNEYGRLAPEAVREALRPDTLLVSVMHANNEIGTLQPVAEIAAIVKAHGALMHTDAAQSAGKVPLDVEALGVDLLTLAGHKFYSTKGVGALYVREGTPIASVLAGAEQERGLRPGTENVPAVVGLGEAARLARERLPAAELRLKTLRDLLHDKLCKAVPGLQLNGHPEYRLPNTLNVSFPGVPGRRLLDRAAEDVAASLGSACHDYGDAVSGVLAAMGFDADRAMGAVRLSVGWMNTKEEIDRAAAALAAAFAGARG
ncbi:cysteine desulfurase family protein [Geobacter sp.]|uniref:cysteine desulfurase family protein n=1 Tax=Geobacter sp. TaxID=46610 RepID=UPI0026161119|nr:cysteine desulfurase family protein [Geobacter sp.]